MTAFVTGGNGFIGSHLIDALAADGQSVVALVRNPDRLRWLRADQARLVTGDLGGSVRDPDALRSALSGVDTLYHLAALTRARTEAEIHDVNVEGTRALLDVAADQHPAPHVVFLSSQTVWGPSPTRDPVDASTPPAPISGYGRSKLAAEQVVSAYAEKTGAPVTIVRAPAVYGPRDAGFGVLIQQAAYRILPRLLGDRWLSIVHVRDLVAGLMLAGGARAPGIHTFTDGPPHSMVELLDAIESGVGHRVWQVPVPEPAYVAAVWAWEQASRLTGSLPPYTVERARESAARYWICSDARARAELGYTSSTPLSQGMKETASWCRDVGWIS